MRSAILTLGVLMSLATFASTEASALVCAVGVVRAGCVGVHGAAVVRRPVVPVVVAPVRRHVIVAPRRRW
jgi:hypothetical protein